MPRITAAEKERVRAKLLKTAATHFAKEGFDGASINRISIAAGFAKGTVYNYFDSKEALLAEVLRQGSDAAVSLFRKRHVAPDVRSRLLALVEADLEGVREHEAIMKVVVRELLAGRKNMRRLVDQSMQSFAKELLSILVCAQENGELGERFSPAQLTRLFLGQMTILYVEQWRSAGKYPTWTGFPELLVDSFLFGAQG